MQIIKKIKIKISNGLEEMNVFINKIDKQTVSKRQRWYGVTERTPQKFTLKIN